MMKMKRTAAFILAGMLGVTTLALGACSQNPGPDGSEHVASPEEITISIDFPKGAKNEDVKEQRIKVEKGSTAYDAIQIYSYVNDIKVYANVTDGKVIGIGSVMNGDKGNKKNSWVLSKNGESPGF